MTEAIPPCPFCGKTNFMRSTLGHTICNVCGAYGPDMSAPQTWSTRPIEDALRAENKRLRAALKPAEFGLVSSNAVEIARAALKETKP